MTVGRRGFLAAAGLAAGGLLTGGLAGCGSAGPAPVPTQTPLPPIDLEGYWGSRRKTGQLDFANWPLYIDTSDANKNDHPSLDLFTRTTGIRVTYSEVIQDNDVFVPTIVPLLAADKPIGYDLMVLTNDPLLTNLMTLNYLVPLDHNLLRTFQANADPAVVSPAYDPGNRYTVAWQSGITGIAYDPDRTKREITSFNDLFDPAFKGRIGMFGDYRDLPNFALVGMGIKPETSTSADWKKAADKIEKQRLSGIVRGYYQQNYIDALSRGDTWLSMAYSGDVFQANANGANLRFVVPQEGGILWTDNMCIPATAPHPVDAITYMDFVYRTDIAAMLAEGINYITPVPFSRGQILTDSTHATGSEKATLRALIDSPLIYPSRTDLRRLSRYRILTAAEAVEWNKIFAPVAHS